MGRGTGVAEGTAVLRRSPERARKRRPYRWTDRRIAQELQRLVEENDNRIPSAPELEAAGLSGLRRAIGRRGIAFWAEWLEVPLAPGQDRTPYGLEQALEEARAVLETEGRIPGPSRLRELGRPRLAGFVVKQGGVKKFCAQNEIPRIAR